MSQYHQVPYIFSFHSAHLSAPVYLIYLGTDFQFIPLQMLLERWLPVQCPGVTWGMFGLRPKLALPIFWSLPKLWALFGWFPIICHANGSLANVVHFSCQCWLTHEQLKCQPKFWLAKYLVGNHGLQPNMPLLFVEATLP
jgi:hypothetical protein